MKKFDTIPVFNFIIDEEDDTSGVKAVSLVASPAMKSKMVAFNEDKPKRKFVALKTDDEYQKVVLGIMMQPDLPIYRNDEDGEYYGVFTKDTIKKIVHKFHKEQQYTDDVNLNHEADNKVNAYMFGDYIVDSELQIEDLKNKGIEDAVIGSWVAMYKVEDDEVFQQILDGEFQGFSIEIFLEKQLRGALSLSTIKNNNKFKEIRKMKKTLLEKLTEKLNQIVKEISFDEALVPEMNITLTWGEIGEAVTKTYINESEEEVTEPVGEGEFTIEDGRIIVTDEQSNLVEIRDAVEEVQAKEEKSGEKTIVYNEVGEAVTIDGEAAPEGDITLDSGVVLVVDASGNLVEVKEAPVEETEEELKTKLAEEPQTESVTAVLDKLLGTYGDGDFSIMVTKMGGEYKWGTVSMYKNIELASQEKDGKIAELTEEINKLKTKMSEAIAEPRLNDEPIVEGKDFKSLSVYEKVARRKNLPLM